MEEKIKSQDELKFGDILILRNNERYVYADDHMYAESDTYYGDGDCVSCNYTDFENDDDSNYDIVKVIRAGKVIYERIIKEMTLNQICKELGYEVKIVKEGEDD